MGGKHSRTKGHGFERAIAVAIRAVFPNARRHLEYHADDANGVDLINTGRFKIQCKKLKGYAPINRIEEVECDQALGDVPVLITAADNRPAMAVIPFSDFLHLIRNEKD